MVRFFVKKKMNRIKSLKLEYLIERELKAPLVKK